MIRPRTSLVSAACVAILIGAFGRGPAVELIAGQAAADSRVPQFEYDPTWPKQPFPNNWIIGNVIGLDVDAKDHVWVLHRPATVTDQEKGASVGQPDAECCRAAPPVLELDAAGSLIQAWGPAPGTPWVDSEHGISVDHKDNVWIGSPSDSLLLKFTRAGKFQMQIGEKGHKTPTSTDPKILGGPNGVVDPVTNELYVADGYRNRRVIVFDADTGAFKRQWGAYGKPADDSVPWAFKPDGPPASQFQNVTGVSISRDGLVYVCDRGNSRVQVFKKDGTFIKEQLISPRTPRGTVDTIAFSPDPEQRYAYVADPRNMKIWILRRSDLQILGSFGRPGHFGGGFTSSAYVAVDSKHNLYVGEGQDGKRVQRFVYKGLGPAAPARPKAQ
jgi:sugar lactone lactonase YvrE